MYFVMLARFNITISFGFCTANKHHSHFLPKMYVVHVVVYIAKSISVAGDYTTFLFFDLLHFLLYTAGPGERLCNVSHSWYSVVKYCS